MYQQLVNTLRKNFLAGKTQDIEWRRSQLKALLRMLDEQKDAMIDALQKDLHKPSMESLGMEIFFSRNEVVHYLQNLDKWTKPEYVKKDLINMMAECYIKPEPLGVVLIIGAWNYPVQLCLCPLIGAIAAGNAAVIKPSEVSSNVATLLERIIPQYLDQDAIQVVTGGVPETTSLLEERYDHILYTGNAAVGKIIMKAASKYLTPVTLEMGGKSPCYVDETSDLNVAARRIAWGRFANCGQTCVAPDYVLCTKEVQDKLVPKLKSTLEEFYGSDPQKSNSYGRLVNGRHWQRVKELIKPDKVAIGGQMDEKDNYISPTVMINCTEGDAAMQSEIFGPVLPIVPIKSIDEALSMIQGMEKPLAMYIFSNNGKVTQKLKNNSTSGSLLVNDCLMQGSLATLPFGGVGHSGMGAYHGKFTFDTFSHHRSCMIKNQAMESMMAIRYPPYTATKDKWFKRISVKQYKEGGMFGIYSLIILSIIAAVFIKVYL